MAIWIRTLGSMKALSLLLVPLLFACRTTPDYNRELPAGADALIRVDRMGAIPNVSNEWFQREEILPALAKSIEWTRTKHARQFFPIEGISHGRALRSLERFEELLLQSESAAEFGRAVEREFDFYMSAGWDGNGGGVLFTGYCTPILEGSLERRAGWDHPLYALPEDLVKDKHGVTLGQDGPAGLHPYPTRRAIEASHTLSGKGLELVWMRDPIDAYIAHVNGSAFIRLPNGDMLRLGYSGTNGRDYSSLGKELIEARVMDSDSVSLASIRRWADANPGEVDKYLHRNDRYVFFTPIDGNPRGSLNVPVTGGRSLATDKRLFPRGSLVFVETKEPIGGDRAPYRRLMLDQDTGGAIRTAGRGDLYLGVGDEAEDRAGTTRVEGQMYYLFLKK